LGTGLSGASPVTIIQQPFGAADALIIESGTFLVLAANLRAVFFVLTDEALAAFFFDFFGAVFDAFLVEADGFFIESSGIILPAKFNNNSDAKLFTQDCARDIFK
jgi:hypothetical protein